MVELVKSFSLATYIPISQDTDEKVFISFSVGAQPIINNKTDTKLLHNISAIDAFAEGKNVDMFTTIICDS